MQALGESSSSSSGSIEALFVRERSEAKKNSGNHGHSQSEGRGRSVSASGGVARDECAYCHKKGHWKKDCLKKRVVNVADIGQKD